jgi:hypothetical protein
VPEMDKLSYTNAKPHQTNNYAINTHSTYHGVGALAELLVEVLHHLHLHQVRRHAYTHADTHFPIIKLLLSACVCVCVRTSIDGDEGDGLAVVIDHERARAQTQMDALSSLSRHYPNTQYTL